MTAKEENEVDAAYVGAADTNGETEGHWTPETVLSTLSYQPPRNTSSALPFLHTISRLKTTKREGWRRFGISSGESISDHMYRMSIITLLCPPALASRIDVSRAMKLALVHDMAESLVGDITPVDNVSKKEKSRREESTMDYLCGPSDSLLSGYGGGLVGKDIKALWLEYEDSETLEAKFVHDVDKIELLLQTVEYERAGKGGIDLGEFTHVAKRVELEEMKDWAAQILKERDEFWKGLGVVPSSADRPMDPERKAQLEEYYRKAKAEGFDN